MFEAYSIERSGLRESKRLLGSTAAALAVYGTLGVTGFFFARTAVTGEANPITEVVFAPAPSPEPVAKPAAPRPPKRARPQPKVVAPEPPPIAPAPVPETKTPAVMPTAPAPEAAPKPAPSGEANDGAVGLVDANAKPGGAAVSGAKGDGPINLPAGATPPVPSRRNKIPEMPQAARAKGIEGVVIVRIVVDKEGNVAQVHVVQGDPVLVKAVLEVVKGWKYEPAEMNGKPIAVYRVLKIPFRLSSSGR